MSSDTAHFVDLIPTWIAATMRAKVVAPAPEDLEDQVRGLRERLREGGLFPSDFEPSEENLTVLSHLCALLSLEPDPIGLRPRRGLQPSGARHGYPVAGERLR